MSSNTKIIVLKSKELIYTGIFIILGILLILLMIYMFSSKNNNDEETVSSINTSVSTTPTYSSGVYSSELNLGGKTLSCNVTVNDNQVNHISIENLDESITVMYPLVEPCLDNINHQLENNVSLENITYSSDDQYTSIIILEAAKQALETSN